MNLEMIKELRESLNKEIQEFIDSREDYYNICVNDYITQNTKYKVGDKFNHPVVGEIVIKEIRKHSNPVTFGFYYEIEKGGRLSEEELDKSEKIEFTVQEKLEQLFEQDFMKDIFN